MLLFHKTDTTNGNFVEDVILDAQPTREDGTPDPAYIATPCPGGFFWPRWNGKAWEEGGTAPEPVTPKPTLEERNRADIDYLAMMMEVEL